MSKEFITNVLDTSKTSVVYKNVKEGTKSFRITQKLVKGIWDRAKRLRTSATLVLTIPGTKKENYVLRCYITKEKT